MGKEYKLVELTEEENDNLVHACDKCVADKNEDLCLSLYFCGINSYFIEVKTDDK